MKRVILSRLLWITVSAGLLLVACNSQAGNAAAEVTIGTPALPPKNVDVDFTLQTTINNGKLAYIGIGGEIDGIVNPDLLVSPGTVVRVTLLNGDGMQHDFFIPDLNAQTSFVSKIGEQAEVIFEVGDGLSGTYVYYCTVSGHRQAGQEGKLIVQEAN